MQCDHRPISCWKVPLQERGRRDRVERPGISLFSYVIAIDIPWAIIVTASVPTKPTTIIRERWSCTAPSIRDANQIVVLARFVPHRLHDLQFLVVG